MSCSSLWATSSAVVRTSRCCCTAIAGKPAATVGLLAAGLAIAAVSFWPPTELLNALEWMGVNLYSTSAQSVMVAMLGLCLFPSARATMSWGFGSPTSGCSGKAKSDCGAAAGDSASQGPQQPVPAAGAARGNDGMLEATAGAGAAPRPVIVSQPSLSILDDDCKSSCSSSPRRRSFKIPRVSVELTPLPRLSVGFSDAKAPSTPGLQRHRWRPGMTRIQSGQDLAGMGRRPRDKGCGSSSSLDWGPGPSPLEPLPSPSLVLRRVAPLQPVQHHLPAAAAPDAAAEGPCRPRRSFSESGLADMGREGGPPAVEEHEATASLGLDELPAGEPGLAEVVSDVHLLQFAAMLGETSSRSQLQQREAGGPMGHPDSFYGSPDTDAFQGPWEQVVSEQQPGTVRYWAWRRPLRRGVFMYMTRTVFLGASPGEVRRFMLDDAFRRRWDPSMMELRHLSSSSPSGSAAAGATPGEQDELRRETESGFMYARVSFPKPMASRAYVYGRRVWPRPCDGGCFCLARACPHPAVPKISGRVVMVADYVSGCVIRRPARKLLPPRYAGPAAEVMLIYYEDSQVRPALANLGIKKGLWPLVLRTERALRSFQKGTPPGTCTAPTPGAGPGDITLGSSCRGAGVEAATAAKWLGLAGGKSSSMVGLGAALAGLQRLVRGLAAPVQVLLSRWARMARVQLAAAALLPAIEWRLLQWLAGKCAAPIQRLTAAAGPAVPSGSAAKLTRPVGVGSDCSRRSWGYSGGRRAVSEVGCGGGRVLLNRVCSHPLEEVQQEQRRQELLQWAGAAASLLAASQPHHSRLQQLQQEEGGWGAGAAATAGTTGAALGSAISMGGSQDPLSLPVTRLQRLPSHPLSEGDVLGASEEDLAEEVAAWQEWQQDQQQGKAGRWRGASMPLADLEVDEEASEGASGHTGAASEQQGQGPYLSPAVLARLPSGGGERLLGEDWPVAGFSAAAGYRWQAGAGDWGGPCGDGSCSYCYPDAASSLGGSERGGMASTQGGCGCGYSSSRASSRCGSAAGAGRVTRRRRRLMLRLIQAAGVRLVHHILVGTEGGQRQGD